MMHPIKQDYSKDIALFIKSGGKIQQAKNTNKRSWNTPSDQERVKIDSKTNRENALKNNLVSYKTIEPCKRCDTYERSAKSNACLECDRRRNRNAHMTQDKLNALAIFLLAKGSTTIKVGRKEYTLKIEENNNG